jgi:uncharacterized protein YodC (DUF2158 family)
MSAVATNTNYSDGMKTCRWQQRSW